MQSCADCSFEFPLDRTNCPRCARPQLFPNVNFANTTQEQKKLDAGYVQALQDADVRGCRVQVDEFDNACRGSAAVFRCTTERLHRQIGSGTDLFETYYQLEQLRLRTDPSSGLDFQKLRPQAEIELLGNEKYAGKLHYACLSLDGQGIPSYGDCVVQLDERWIAHRASCFEGNTAVIYKANATFSDKLRSDWRNRHKLCVAIRSCDVDPSTADRDFPEILARAGATAEDDIFIEVHLLGDMVSSTFQSVHFTGACSNRRDEVYREAIIEQLTAAGVAATS
ncbi:MAG: hypothetical protein K1X67_08390 [Fimbriimonadaceae bacterium]|nr:hypothetical protein [Fimbriimonadaceae bacterium]